MYVYVPSDNTKFVLPLPEPVADEMFANQRTSPLCSSIKANGKYSPKVGEVKDSDMPLISKETVRMNEPTT